MDPFHFYSTQSPITDPREYVGAYDNLPDDVPSLYKVVQGLVIHRNSLHLYGLKLTEERKQEGETRYVSAMLQRIFEHDPSELTVARPPNKRFAGVCRDFEVLLCSVLRHQGIPARLRCGFAGYFTDKFEDHWLCEYWNKGQRRWVLVDANVDEVERKAYKVTIDTLDVPQPISIRGYRVAAMP